MNSRFRPYRIILSRQGGSINIIQVTVYFFTVPALKLMNVKFCLFLATTAHCHDRAAIKIHITTFNCINLQVRCGNLHNFNCFWLSYIYIKFVYYETCISFVVNQNLILKKNRTSGGRGKALRTRGRGGGLKWPKICRRPLWTAP